MTHSDHTPPELVEDPYRVQGDSQVLTEARVLWWPLVVGAFVFVGSTLIGIVALWGIAIAMLVTDRTFDPQVFLLRQMDAFQLVLFFGAVAIIVIVAAGIGAFSKRNTERALLRRLESEQKRETLSQQVNELKSALKARKEAADGQNSPDATP